MKLSVAILISGSGSNMVQLIKSMDDNHPAFPSIVISNKPNAAGIKKAQDLGIPTQIINENFEKSNGLDFEAKLEEIKLIENQTNEGKRSWVITTQITCGEKDYPLYGYLSLVIHHNGTRLFTVSTMWKEQKIPLQDGMILKWVIDASKLTTGQYTLDLMIQLNPADQPVDYILNCLSIDMPDCDYWGTGRRQHPGLDKVFNDFTFEQI